MKYRVVGLGALVAMVAVAWVPLAGQALRVADNPAAAPSIRPSRRAIVSNGSTS